LGIEPLYVRREANSARWQRMTFMELDRCSIRTGCETDENRQADAELRRRGYTFNTTEQKWAPTVEQERQEAAIAEIRALFNVGFTEGGDFGRQVYQVLHRHDLLASPSVVSEPPRKKRHDRSCPAYGNYQPPYEECNCGYESANE